jgi:hypothetical protein
MSRHRLSFRGQSHAIPATYALCTRCGALLQIAEWIDTECPGPDVATRQACGPDASSHEENGVNDQSGG